MDSLQSQTRLFRGLLYCYPAEFRHEYGAEMESLFAARLHAEPTWRLWLESVADIASTAPQEWWHAVVSDVRFETRALIKTPGFSLIAVLVMGLGIAATASVFSVVNAVLLRSLPYGHPQQLVYLWSPFNHEGIPEQLGPNVPDFYEWQRSSKSFSSMAAFDCRRLSFVRQGVAIPVGAAFVSAGFFQTLDAWPALGRALNESDNRPGQDHVAVISDAFWRSELAATPHPLGLHVQFNRETYTVVGIMPADFGYPFDGDVPYEHPGFQKTDLWLPVAHSADQRSNRTTFISSNAIGRLREGVSPRMAQAELMVIEHRLQPLYPLMWRGWTVKIGPLVDTILGPVQQMMWLLLGAVAAVLLIAVSNVSNLLLAKSIARAHEMGIRTALGAERPRIMRQLFTGSLLLSILAGAFGIALAYGTVYILTLLNLGGIPRFESAAIDARVLLLAVVLSLASGIMAGLAPALYASRIDVNHLLKNGGTRLPGTANRSRSALIALQVALSMVLAIGAGLMIRSYLRLVAVDPGFSRQTLTFSVVSDDRYGTPGSQQALLGELLRRLQSLPGVKAAGASSHLPLSQSESVTEAEVQGVGKSKELIENRNVTPGYREALGTHLLQGRDFTGQDAKSLTVVLVNEHFARLYLKGRNPIGSYVRTGLGEIKTNTWLTVIGVVADVRDTNLEEHPKPQILQPVETAAHFALASDLPPGLILKQARTIVHALDPGLTLQNPFTLQQRITAGNSRRNFQTLLLLGFAALALALLLAGLYGLIAYSVKIRTAEIGIRLALGSSRLRIAALILGQGLRVVVTGLAIGWTLSFLLMRFISAWLFGITAMDPLTFALVPALMLLLATLACLIPTLSAARTDPSVALRAD